VPRSPVGVVGPLPRDSSYVARLTARCSAAIHIHSVTFGGDPDLRSSAPCLTHMRFLVVKQLMTPPSAMLPAPAPWRSLHLIAYVNLILPCNVETTHALGLPMSLSLLFRVNKFIR
jgi:hypothetical protein